MTRRETSLDPVEYLADIVRQTPNRNLISIQVKEFQETNVGNDKLLSKTKCKGSSGWTILFLYSLLFNGISTFVGYLMPNPSF